MVTYNTNYIRSSSKKTFKKQQLNVCSKKNLSHNIYNNAYILPNKYNSVEYGGVITNDRLFVDNTGLHEGLGKHYYLDNNIEVICGTIIYIGYLNQCWGHIITDFLKKIYFLHSLEGKKFIKEGAKIAFITYENRPITKEVIELISLANLNISNWIHVRKTTLCDRIIVPDNSITRIEVGIRLWSQEYKDTINLIKKNVKNSIDPQIKTYEKLYFTRTHFPNNRDYGEITIENIFKKNGFKIISPERHSVAEQINMLMNCKEFASTEGSISHNAIFCNEQTKCIIIRKAEYWNSYQITINDCANLNVIFIDAHQSCMVSHDAPFGGPFYLCITKELENFFGHHIFHIPYYICPSWFKYKYKEKIKKIYYNLRAKIGLRTKIKLLFRRNIAHD